MHFLEFFFAPHGEVWYHGAVWGNVVAVLPLAVLAFFGWIWHKGVVEETHRKLDLLAAKHDQHAAALAKLLDAVDPDWQDLVLDRLDAATPSGLGDVMAALKERQEQ